MFIRFAARTQASIPSRENDASLKRSRLVADDQFVSFIQLFYVGFAVASSTALIYDWVLTFGDEVELIWVSGHPYQKITQWYNFVGIEATLVLDDSSVSNYTLRWNTILYHQYYDGIFGDRCSAILYSTLNWINVIVAAMLGVITLTRLHAMYQRSRKILIFLTIILLVVNITCGVIAAMVLSYTSGEELILSGTHACAYIYTADDLLLISVTWILTAIWEVLALCLSVWVAVKHFRELRRLGPSTRSTIRDCFRVLLESHLVYFASFTVVCCSAFGTQLSPKVSDLDSAGVQISNAVFEIFSYIQMFVLGPRLILSLRMYHADLVANSDAAASITSIAFQDTIHVPTFSSV
ncbi:uncharacterized protein F5147DRAFT_776596 [Suillus discolor]|uniref:DUF6533 domain-containing protein n=1 Tax=Suillus discolor TaxID=1912936 RepID=A0A9P7F1V1_9AGAM|nr:uncharacterized protein F5147DRAFT_776596 [Suillus discolor]KAG2101594.1 hypothetical protein F5147DRAFT_776596 [Suillus discolor]